MAEKMTPERVQELLKAAERADWMQVVLNQEPQTGPVTDRNGAEIRVGMFVNVPCLIESITPSLNPATTSVTVRTLPNVGGVEYDEGLSLIVYPAQVLKP